MPKDQMNGNGNVMPKHRQTLWRKKLTNNRKFLSKTVLRQGLEVWNVALRIAAAKICAVPALFSTIRSGSIPGPTGETTARILRLYREGDENGTCKFSCWRVKSPNGPIFTSNMHFPNPCASTTWI